MVLRAIWIYYTFETYSMIKGTNNQKITRKYHYTTCQLYELTYNFDFKKLYVIARVITKKRGDYR